MRLHINRYFTFLREESDGKKPVHILDKKQLFPIDEVPLLQQTDNYPKYSLSSNTIQSNYEFLDFFDPNQNIDYVYFLSKQLRLICSASDKLIVSGGQLNFGKKLSHPQYEAIANFDDVYFTLKVEGEFETIPGVLNEYDEVTDVVLGHPCPPIWYNLRVLEQQAVELSGMSGQINADFFKELRDSWVQNVYNGETPPVWYNPPVIQ